MAHATDTIGLQIRHLTPDDLDAVIRIFSGPAVVRGTLQLPYPSPQSWRRRLAEPEPGLVSLVACLDREPIGMLGIHGHIDMPRLRHTAWIGMAVRDDCQGRGIGTALLRAATELADGWLALVRIELKVFSDNEPAIRLYRRFGFEPEGTLRQAALRDGRLCDVLLMARLRPAPSPATP